MPDRPNPAEESLGQDGRDAFGFGEESSSNGDGLSRDQARRWWRDARRRRMLAAADLLAACAATAFVLIFLDGPLWAFVTTPAWIVVAKLLGLYDFDHRKIRHLTVDEAPRIVELATIGSVLLILLVSWRSPGTTLTLADLAEVAALGTFSVLLLRGAARFLWRRTTRPEFTAIVGEGPLGQAIQRKIELFPDIHIKLTKTGMAPLEEGGSLSPALSDLLHRVDRLIVASDAPPPMLIGDLARACRDRQVKLTMVSPFLGSVLSAPRLSQLAELPMLEYQTWDVSRSTTLLKRVFDFSVSATALVLLSPVFAVIAVAVKLDSSGPVLFRQKRAGFRGRPFTMIKFRSMSANAEERLTQVVRVEELDEPMFKLRGDPRVTRLGRFLRRYSLDELPQLINVFKGDMSLVGPRPEELAVVDRYRPEHCFRLDARPGMTGPMQVFGRGELTFTERLAVEMDYLENPSLTRDLRILAMTISVVARGTGAY